MASAMSATPRSIFTIGTRKSKLAMLQTELVRDTLTAAFPHLAFEACTRDTAGDRNKTTPLSQFAGKNLWTEELEELLAAGEIDFVVHSLKDVPTTIPSTFKLADTLARADPRDALVVKQGHPYTSLATLPAGAVVGTSSVRRTAQLARHHPQLRVQSHRGNIDTRLRKLDDPESGINAIVLAAAGLQRAGLAGRITQYLDVGTENGGMYHAVGQGALGIEMRVDDAELCNMLAAVGDQKASLAVWAERQLLRTLEGGCSAPLGVRTSWRGEGKEEDKEGETLVMQAIVCSVDGREAVEVERAANVTSTEEAEAFGDDVAKALVAGGADKILTAIQAAKEKET